MWALGNLDRYRPSAPVIRALARTYLRQSVTDETALQTCQRRGFIRFGSLTADGHEVLDRAQRQFAQSEGR